LKASAIASSNMKSTSSSSSYTVLYMHAALYNVIYRLLLQRTTSYRLLARSMRLGRRCPSYFTHTKINAVTCRGARIFNISVRSLSNLTVYRAKVIIVPHRIIWSFSTLAVDGWDVTVGAARRGLDGAFLAVPNVTSHPSTASVPFIVLLYNGSLLCGFNVLIKELRQSKLGTLNLSKFQKIKP